MEDTRLHGEALVSPVSLGKHQICLRGCQIKRVPAKLSRKYASTQSQEDESSGLYQALGFGLCILQRNTANHIPSLVPPLSSSRQIRKEASLQEMVQETGLGQEEKGDSRAVSGKELADK